MSTNRPSAGLIVAEGTRRSMRANRSSETGPERALRKALWAEGLRGYRKNVASLPGKPDIVFTKRRVCVFVNGCFWHGCPKCSQVRNLKPTNNADYWSEKVMRTVARDEKHVQELEEAAWCVITVWECEVKANAHAVVRRIVGSLGAHAP